MKKLLLVVLVLLGLNQTQAQTENLVPYFCCDSITYWTDQSQGFNVGLDTSNIVHNPDSITVYWGVCTNGMCYAGNGMFAYFGQIMTTDTLKICYDAYLYEANAVEVCTRCDSVIFDQNTGSWVLFSMGNTTNIEELAIDRFEIDANIYDLSGRQLKQIPLGVMYIKNRKLYIKTK
tara:strand:+ start:8685 stop:9212 length:528 start_codon:yes stop_codon:yes gene_type:complete